MSLKFFIKELGPIRNSEFEFKPFIIFTGESNLGKSYSAFLIYGFFKLIEEKVFKKFIEKAFDFSKISEQLRKNETENLTFKIQEFEKYLNENISNQIAYLTGNEDLKCNVKISTGIDDINIKLNNPNVGKKLFGKQASFIFIDGKYLIIDKPLLEQYEDVLINLFHTKIYIVLLKGIFGKARIGTILLPPGRGAVYPSSFTLKKNISNTGMFNDFLEKMDQITTPSIIKREQDSLINSLLHEIFQGKIIVEKDMFFYEFDKQKIPLQSAASSIKELAPLNLILQKSKLHEISILLEEPEAHLHPKLQRKVAKLLAYFVNKGGFLQVTTHSDYFLNQVNNLIKLFFVKENMKETFPEYMNQIAKYGIKEKMILNPKDVGAYYFSKRPDNTVQIITQNLKEEAVPFDTFEKTVDNMMEETDIINEVFYSE